MPEDARTDISMVFIGLVIGSLITDYNFSIVN